MIRHSVWSSKTQAGEMRCLPAMTEPWSPACSTWPPTASASRPRSRPWRPRPPARCSSGWVPGPASPGVVSQTRGVKWWGNSYIELQAENVAVAEDSFHPGGFVFRQTKVAPQTLIFPISQSHGGGAVLRLNSNIVCRSQTDRLRWGLFTLFIIKKKSGLKD